MTLETILASILKNIFVLLPFRMPIVYEYQQGVKFRAGKVVKLLKHDNGFFNKGIHFNWVWLESITIMDTVPEIIDTTVQTCLTKDNIDVSVSASVWFETYDLSKYLTQIQSAEISLANLTEAIIIQHIVTCNLKDLTTNIKNIQIKVKKDLEEQVKHWGLNLIECYIVDMCRTRALRLFSDHSNVASQHETNTA